MKAEGGYVRIYRRIWDNPIFRNAQEASVFVWMVSTAQWQDNTINTKFGPVPLHLGELIVAERDLADRFGLDRNAVQRLISRMTDAAMISIDRNRGSSRIGAVFRVLSYAQYQSVRPTVTEPELSLTRASSDPDLSQSAFQKTDLNHATTSDIRCTLSQSQADHEPVVSLFEAKNKEGKEGRKKDKDTPYPMPAEPPSAMTGDLFPGAQVVRLPHDQLDQAAELWNDLAASCGLAQIRGLTKERKASLRLRIKECGGLDGWRAVLEKIRGSPFLLGSSGGWKADFDFVLKPTKFQRIIEGTYGGTGQKQPANKLDHLREMFGLPMDALSDPGFDIEQKVEVR